MGLIMACYVVTDYGKYQPVMRLCIGHSGNQMRQCSFARTHVCHFSSALTLPSVFNHPLLQRINQNAPLLLLACTFLWACNWIITRAMRDDMGPLSMALFRWVIALCILLPITVRSIRTHWHEIRRDWLLLVAMSFTGTGAYNAMAITGLRTTTAINGTLLNAVIPIVIAGLSWIFLRKRVTALQAFWMAVSFAGAAWIGVSGKLDDLLALRFNVGDLWVVGGMVSWAVYTILLAKRRDSMPTLTLIAVLSSISMLALLPLAAWEIAMFQRPSVNPQAALGLLFQGIFPSIVCYYAWNRGVQLAGAARAGVYVYLIPVFGAALSSLLLNEHFQGFHVVGAALILVGVIFANRSSAHQAQPTASKGA
jgi:drug/metabolite transporter (DMT)-like permease